MRQPFRFECCMATRVNFKKETSHSRHKRKFEYCQRTYQSPQNGNWYVLYAMCFNRVCHNRQMANRGDLPRPDARGNLSDSWPEHESSIPDQFSADHPPF